MQLSDILRARQEQRKKGINWKKEAEFLRAKFKREEMLKIEEAERARKRRLQDLEEERRLKKIADDEAERIHKTKEYFQLDRLMRPFPEVGRPMYYGDNIASKYGTWIPHGVGALHFEDRKYFEGKWEKGVMHGSAYFKHEDGSKWEGNFRFGAIHGVGFLTRKGKQREEVLAYNNLVHCYRSELYDGKQVELNDPSLRLGSNTRPRVTIMSHRKGWSFLCRFHDEVHPRERYVDFSTLKDFKILHHLPLVYDMNRFGLQTEADVRYNFWEDVYGQATRPKLGHAGGRFNATMKPHGVRIKPAEEKPKTSYDENVFESQEMGIGRTLMEKERLRVLDQKMEAWNKSLEEKRAIEEEERARRVEEEQARLMEEAQAKQNEKHAQRRAEEEARKALVDKENSKWDEQDQARSKLESHRALSRERNIHEKELLHQSKALEPLSGEELRSPSKTNFLGGHRPTSPVKVVAYKESKLTTKALKVLPRIQSRYRENRARYLNDDVIPFDHGVVVAKRASVNYSYYSDYLGSSAENISAFIGLSVDSDMGGVMKKSTSCIPLPNEETRIYEYSEVDLTAIRIPMTSTKLAADSLHVTLYEDVKGQRPTKIGSASFDFESVRNHINEDVDCSSPFFDGDEERGVIHLTLRAIPD